MMSTVGISLSHYADDPPRSLTFEMDSSGDGQCVFWMLCNWA